MPGSHSKKDKLKKKIAKVRKADQQDINRVKRWNSKTFNKKKELSGPTEKTFVPPKYPSVDLKGRPYPGMTGDEVVAKLRNRLAKIENYNAEADPEASPGEWIKKYKKNRKNKIAKVRKANGGIAPNYNNPSKVRKKKTATKAASHTKEDVTVRTEKVDKFMKNSPSGEKMMKDITKNRKRFMDQAREMKGYVEKGVKINPK